MFIGFYPGSSTKPASQTHFRYDPSLGELEQPGGPQTALCKQADRYAVTTCDAHVLNAARQQVV